MKALFILVLGALSAPSVFAEAKDRIREFLTGENVFAVPIQKIKPSAPPESVERAVRALEARFRTPSRSDDAEDGIFSEIPKPRVFAIDLDDSEIVSTLQEFALDLKGQVRQWKNGRQVKLLGKYSATVSIRSGLAWRLNDHWHLVLPRVKSRAIGVGATYAF